LHEKAKIGYGSGFYKRWLKWFLGFILPVGLVTPLIWYGVNPQNTAALAGVILIEALLLSAAILLSYKFAKSLQQAEETHGKLRWKQFWFNLLVEFLLLFIAYGVLYAIKDKRLPLFDALYWALAYSLVSVVPAFTSGNLQESKIVFVRVAIFGLLWLFGYGVGIVTQSPQSSFEIYPMFMLVPFIAGIASVLVYSIAKRKRTPLSRRMLEASAFGFSTILILQFDFFLSARGILILIVLVGIYLWFKYRPKQKNDTESVV
jgi:hypothetical protein